MTTQQENDGTVKAAAFGRRLCVYNGGLLTKGTPRRILELAGWEVTAGLPREGDWVGLWGRSRTAWRAQAVAGWTEAPVLTVEDAFLRSVHPGRVRGEAPVGLCLDQTGVHFDGGAPSDLERLFAAHALDDTALLDRAREAMDSLAYWHVGKYSATDPALAAPDPGYVIVVDQTKGDAALMGAGRAAFLEMLAFAAEEHPGGRIVVKTHPETGHGGREGHFTAEDATGRVTLESRPIAPRVLFEGAVAVYTHSSTLGFEAIFAGHRPRVFGQPFYAGWGLTQDQDAPPRRARTLTRAQLFAAAMILYPTWYDPVADRLCEVEEVVAGLAARARAWREDRGGYVAVGMKPWKRPHLSRAFGREVPVRFARSVPESGERRAVVWGMAEAPEGTLRMEDGFLRSRGLGAALVPPLSLVLDAPTLYFDAREAGRLDALIGAVGQIPVGELRRSERLIRSIRAQKLTKYNIGAVMPEVPSGRRVLVAGQVENDASMLYGAGEIRTNLDLLRHAREANPDAVILYKPHPDVEAGLRVGAVEDADVTGLADVILTGVSAAEALTVADEVWTMTSTLGFEALLRAVPVTCLGMPFYAGRGLTRDLAPRPAHREGQDVTLAQLVHACLIAYPRYFHPATGEPISPEQAVRLLAEGVEMPRVNKALAWLHGLVAPFRR